MPKQWKRRCAGWLACLMLVGLASGCSNSGTPAPQPESEASAPVSAPVPTPTAPDGFGQQAASSLARWRQQYYDVVAANLQTGNGLAANTCTLYSWYGEAPLLVVGYAATQNAPYLYNSYYRAWYIRDGQAASLAYEGEHRVAGVQRQSGNPVVIQLSTENGRSVSSYVEITEAEPVPLYDYSLSESGFVTVRTHDDGQTWALYELLTRRPLDRFAINSDGQQAELQAYFFPAFDDVARLYKLSEFLGLSTYSPQVPQGAPAWVEAYLAYIHNQLFFSYYPTQKVDLYAMGVFGGIYLLEPPVPGGPPVLEMGGLVQDSTASSFYYLLENGRILEMPNNLDGGYVFTRDEAGRVLVQESASGSAQWYSLGADGLTLLFREGHGVNGQEQYAYFDGVLRGFGDSYATDALEKATTWLEECRAERLKELGYAATTLTQLEQNYHILPMETTWEALEADLMQYLCGYAVEQGQWIGEVSEDLLPGDDTAVAG